MRPAVRVAGGPRISPLAPCFYLLHVLSWSAAETLLDPCPPHPAAPPSQTNDNWATDNTQCLVPGYGAPSLYTSGQIYGTLAPTSYPVTYDQKGACGQVVFTSDLVDKANANNVYGRLYAWKVGKGRAGHMAAPMLPLPLRSTAPSALSGDPLRAGLPNLPSPTLPPSALHSLLPLHLTPLLNLPPLSLPLGLCRLPLCDGVDQRNRLRSLLSGPLGLWLQRRPVPALVTLALQPQCTLGADLGLGDLRGELRGGDPRGTAYVVACVVS